MATIDRIGYGQVEPNHLSAQVTGQIYAQLPAAKAITMLENGQFAKYDYENKEVNFTGDGEWYLVYNEVRLYDPMKQGYKDFALIKTDFVGEEMTPRLYKINIGDIYTTNTLEKAAVSNTGKTVGTEEISVGTLLAPDSTTGYLKVTTAGATGMKLKVVKVYTMPDGQQGVKLQRIA